MSHGIEFTHRPHRTTRIRHVLGWFIFAVAVATGLWATAPSPAQRSAERSQSDQAAEAPPEGIATAPGTSVPDASSAFADTEAVPEEAVPTF